MSGTPPVDPYGTQTPEENTWGTLRAGIDTDTRAKDFAADLTQIPDTIASVASVVVSRQDGAPITSADLSVLGQPVVDPAGLSVTLWLQAGTSEATYVVSVTIVTVGGRRIGRDVLVAVAAFVA